MKKIFLITTLLATLLSAKEYKTVVEPYDSFTLYAQSAGDIVYLDRNDEAKTLNKVIIKIDSQLERDKLEIYKEKLTLLKKELALKKSIFKNISSIEGKSQLEKDSKEIEVIELELRVKDLQATIFDMEETIRNKSVRVDDLYLKEFYVNMYDYVNMGTKLAKLQDKRKSRLIIYVTYDDYKNIKNKTVYIDGKKANVNFIAVDDTPDSVYISSYKVQLESSRKDFGKVVSVEFKNEKAD